MKICLWCETPSVINFLLWHFQQVPVCVCSTYSVVYSVAGQTPESHAVCVVARWGRLSRATPTRKKVLFLYSPNHVTDSDKFLVVLFLSLFLSPYTSNPIRSFYICADIFWYYCFLSIATGTVDVTHDWRVNLLCSKSIEMCRFLIFTDLTKKVLIVSRRRRSLH